MGGRQRITVGGGGVIGASVAYHLARAGARVTLLERLPQAGGGATRWSYGWVGTGAGSPSKDPTAFALQVRALEDFRRLDGELGGLPKAARGAIVGGTRNMRPRR